MLHALDNAGRLLAKARREHETSIAQGRISVAAAAVHRLLRVVAGLDHIETEGV